MTPHFLFLIEMGFYMLLYVEKDGNVRDFLQSIVVEKRREI